MSYNIHPIANLIRSARFLAAACLVALPLLQSCMHEGGLECPGMEAPDQGEHTNLTLVLSLAGDPSQVTRASENPLGGEDGNGLRQGEHHENDIDELCVFAFSDDDHRGITNLDASTPVKYCKYVDEVNFHPTHANSYYGDIISTEVKIQFEGKIVGQNDAFLVIANAGDLTDENLTLGQIRNLLIERTLTRPATEGAPLAQCTHFAMASAHNSRNLGGRGTELDPYRVAIDLERITARVDFWYQSPLAADNHPQDVPSTPLLGYPVLDKYDASHQTGWMYISHIRLMNVAQYAPYALKRLALSESDTPYFLYDESHVDDEAVLYVVEPNTWEKGKLGTVTYDQLYGNTRIQYASAHYQEANYFQSRHAVHPYATPETYPNDRDGFNAGWSQDRISGEAYYVLDYINENTVEKEHTSGLNTTSLLLKTKFVPKELLYVDGPALQSRAATYGETFWAMEVMTATTRQKHYFATEEAAALYRTLHAEDTFGPAVEYADGVNYYTIWIRHDNNDNDALIGKMEYGIVRNNIYRIGVSKVSGPGNPSPVPTENPEDVTLHLYVRKWNYMSVPTINI